AEQSDLARFRGMRDAGRAAAARGEHAGAAELLTAALREWRGTALADLRVLRAAEDIAVALDEEHLLAIEDRIDAQLHLGQHSALNGELAELTAAHPLRESLWTRYLTALYRSGRQADALAAYGRMRTRLRDELGIDPGAELRSVHEAILRQDLVLAAST